MSYLLIKYCQSNAISQLYSESDFNENRGFNQSFTMFIASQEGKANNLSLKYLFLIRV